MAVCPSCGNKKFGLRVERCISCGRPGCDRCLSAFSHMVVNGASYVRYVCSTPCFERWAWGFVSNGYALEAIGPGWALHGIVLDRGYDGRVQDMVYRHHRALQLTHAQNLMAAERHEDAARVYEGLGMWKEAGDARRSGRRTVMTQVQVNLNELVRQMREGGLTTTYTCPACRSPILISGDTAGQLRTCSYCGSTIQTTDLVEFLRRAVG